MKMPVSSRKHGTIDGAERCANTPRPLTHSLDLTEEGLAMQATQYLTDRDIARFWAKVTLPNPEGCMLWSAYVNAKGYGIFRTPKSATKAHRIALLLADGPPPIPDMQATHSCRNRHCVAPIHLEWGTQAKNEGDKQRDGTDNSGARNGSARLTEADVIAIRAAVGSVRQRDLALRYGVSQQMISKINRGRRWRYLAAAAGQRADR